MVKRIGAFAFAASLLTAGGASAQTDDLGGTVVHVDPAANTVTFSDGRIVHYDPLWRVLVNGREVAITEVQPGSVIAIAPSGTPVQAVVPGASQPAMAQVAPGSVSPRPPLDARGTVVSVDETRRTVTLQDGRVVSISEVQVTRGSSLNDLRPGAQVYVSKPGAAEVRGPSTVVTTPAPAVAAPGPVVATPGGVVATPPGAVVTTPSAAAGAWPPTASPTTQTTQMRGKVTTVTPHGSQILLSDGTTVLVGPATTIQAVDPQMITVNELRPGDEVVVQVQEVVPVAGVAAVTTTDGVAHDVVTVPTYRYPGSSKVAADRVLIVRRPEAQ